MVLTCPPSPRVLPEDADQVPELDLGQRHI